LKNWQAFVDLAKRFAEGDVRLRVAGLAGSARALVIAELLQRHPRPVLVVVASLADAHRFAQDLKFFGAAAFEQGEVTRHLVRGELPPNTDVHDDFAHASGALCWDLELGAGGAREVEIAVPFGERAPDADDCAALGRSARAISRR